MQNDNRLIEDLARVAAGAMGVAQGMRDEVEARLKEQFERVISRMDLVTREEFEVVRALAEIARAEQEDLARRIEALEATKQPKQPKRTASSRAKARAKKSA